MFNLTISYTLFSILVTEPCVASSSYMTKIRGEEDNIPPLDWSLVQPVAGEEAAGCRWRCVKQCVYHPIDISQNAIDYPKGYL
jgi:hypothetical protein